jgi:hypothetical protein
MQNQQFISENSPVIHIDANYQIRGNRTGLLTLIDAVATALASQSECTSEILDGQADVHDLQIVLCKTYDDLYPA